ncbi:uncharacterized protein LOC117610267 isoform X1 [Osmia lignaria lignaria]|uniref:uncharacterized protein LOC117610267 isoform X1 n=2 Tax=Osmia lignaria lignaria TaxID=1437193 RepID=UPI00402BBA6C
MRTNKALFFILYFELQLTWSQIGIPAALRECYRNNSTLNPKLPLNLRVIIDIIQKMERHSYTTMNMRIMSSAILHRFKFDGIEYQKDVRASDSILPFSGTGTQRTKHKLMEELIPGNAEILPVHILSHAERCILHQAISNTVLKYDIEGSNKICSQIIQSENLTGISVSTKTQSCPIQQGVILTTYGTIAPGAIIGAVAATLQHQNVAVNQLITTLETSPSETNSTTIYSLKYNEEEIDFILPRSDMSREPSMWYHALMSSSMKVDNVWLTTIAGELAEMVVYQGPLMEFNMTLGATGFWQNRIRPIIFYLTSPYENFDATRAELLGGIDGMIIASNLKTWIEDFYSLRLSQILEMYYSYKGIAFNTNIRACDRSQAFLYAVPKTILNEQVYAIAQMLAYHKSIAYIPPEILQNLVESATEQFYTYAETYLFPELPCQQINHSRVEALIVFDGSWTVEYTVDFLAALIQDLNVSMYGSKIGIIHGTSGEWLLNITDSPSLAFETLNNLTNISWPTQLNYTKILNTIFTHLNKTWENNEKHHVIGNLGQIVVLLSPLGSMSNDDKLSAMTILREIKYNHPDVHYVYYTSLSNTKFFASFILSSEDHLIENSNMNAITRYASKIPMILRPMSFNSHDSNNFLPQFEDYISPSESITYKMHSNWKQNMEKTSITIHTFGYGTMKACSWIQFKSDDKEKFQCKELTGYKEINLTNHYKCVKTLPCPNVYLQIQNVTSLYKCAEIDCKTPDQVRFIIRMNRQSLEQENSANKNVLVLLNLLTLFILHILM